MSKFVIIDGNAILHRAYHALPPLTTKDGVLVNAVYGFLTILFKVLREIKPERIAVAWDRKEKTFRHEMYKEYKATREKKPQELYDQIPMIKDALGAMRIASLEKQGVEADDIIATLSRKSEIRNPKSETIVVTGDLDALQLVDARTKVYALKRGVSDIVIYDEQAVKERYGLTPSQLIDFKALQGDASDNIPSVPGVGEKTAAELLQKFGTIEKMYQALEAGKGEVSEKLREKLIAHKEFVRRNKTLVTLVREVPLEIQQDAFQLQPFDREKLVELFRKWEFHSLISRVPGAEGGSFDSAPSDDGATLKMTEKKKTILVTDKKSASAMIKALEDADRFALYLAEKPADLFGSGGVAAIGVATDRETFGGEPKIILETLAPFLADEKKIKVVFDAKRIMHLLEIANCKLQIANLSDPMLASYLLQPGSRTIDLPYLSLSVLGEETPPASSPLIKGGIKRGSVHGSAAGAHAALMASRVLRIAEKLEAELKEKGLWKLYEEIELPLVPVLYDMETVGIKIDTALLKHLSAEAQEKLESLAKKIYSHAGEEFNINSSQQLKVILFEKLQIPVEGIRKGKTGLSTAASELEKMRGLHPVIELIFEHRELSKLKSTYLDALPALVKADGRVHTTFNQAVTATGRLSSSDPNLQNIPIRTEFGRKIREAFVADKGFVLLSADYSQIELRIVAHMADDAAMIGIFNAGGDIHTATAAKINGVSETEVTHEMRRAAKAINFGVIYGMGPQGLAEGAGVSFAEAKEFIEKYFDAFKGVAEYMAQMKKAAATQGFVETLFGRRRYLPEITSGVHTLRAAAERMAINAPVQGTAADMMKCAMIALWQIFANVPQGGPANGANSRDLQPKAFASNSPVNMLLQVHDELLFEVQQDKVDAVAPKIREIMEGVVALKVPVKVDLKVGENWGKMKQV